MLEYFADKGFREKTTQQVYENEHLLYDIVRKENQSARTLLNKKVMWLKTAAKDLQGVAHPLKTCKINSE